VDIPATSDNIPGTLVLRDNTGGFDLKPASIVNADISNSAAIAGTKIAPNFGSQGIFTSGNIQISGGNVSVISDTANSIINSARGDNTAPGLFQFRKSRGTSSSPAIVVAGDALGQIVYFGYDGSDNSLSATFSVTSEGTIGTDSVPARFTFSTRATGGGFAERMRIDSGGDVLIGLTSPLDVTTGSNDGCNLRPVGQILLSRNGGVPLLLRRRASNGQIAQFRRDTDLVGDISVTTTATAFNTSSDYRLKQNVEPLIGGLAKLKSLAPKTFEFKVEPDIKVDGFIAHEVQAVVPQAVTGEKDGEEMQGLDMSKLVPVLVAAVQELSAKVEALEAALQPQ
jgi:hypothetical protein